MANLGTVKLRAGADDLKLHGVVPSVYAQDLEEIRGPSRKIWESEMKNLASCLLHVAFGWVEGTVTVSIGQNLKRIDVVAQRPGRLHVTFSDKDALVRYYAGMLCALLERHGEFQDD